MQRDCLLSHLGLWLIEPETARVALAQIQAGAYPEIDAAAARAAQEERLDITEEGIAVIPIVGMMQKGFSFFGGTSTVLARRQIRAAAADNRVRGILLAIDSPGGRVPGTYELAQDVRLAGASKPVRAMIEDAGNSAAYWVASQAQRISINRPGELGSIGTYAVIVDESKRAEMEGLKVHVIAAGKWKGSYEPGTEITDEQLADARRRVERVNSLFLDAVSQGRDLEGARLDAVANGRVFGAEDAVAMGLADAVETSDETLGAFAEELGPSRSGSLAQVGLEIAQMEAG